MTHRIKHSATLLFLFSGMALSGCAHLGTPRDSYQWLEGLRTPQSLQWVHQQNQKTRTTLEKDPHFKVFQKEVFDIIAAKDRIPKVTYRGGMVYNFWQDEHHVRGLWRRTSLFEYKKKHPLWQTLLDLDQLAAKEKQNWVWEGVRCLPRTFRHCLVFLSKGGKDAQVVREFDTRSKRFVKDGFYIKEAKSSVDWLNKDEILVGTDLGPGTMTRSGYPRQIRLLKRHQTLDNAPIILEGQAKDVTVDAQTIFGPKKATTILTVAHDFFSTTSYLWSAERGLQKIDKPDDAEIRNVFNGRLLISLRHEWKIDSQHDFAAGSLIDIDPDHPEQKPTLIYQPTARQSIQDIAVTRDSVFLSLLDNVKAKILEAKPGRPKWRLHETNIPANGSASFMTYSHLENVVIARFEGFLTPTRVLVAQSHAHRDAKFAPYRRLPDRFDSSPYMVEQLEATSKDGTKIPYFVVRSKTAKMDGSNPTLLYGYGGFEISLTPFYMGSRGKVWLQRGGVFVVANIRGGGEFGPAWHNAAIKDHRQRAFDDFAAVAQDLIQRGYTSPAHLAIEGGSNGGLLVSTELTQHPELFGAVVCLVPLTDMLHYTHLGAGASWIAEYGDPANSEMRKVLLKYSPYQNVSRQKTYPPIFIGSSTEDDRVHPAHARKLAARLIEYGHPVYYYENTEGGHSTAANLKERADLAALIYAFLDKTIMSEAPTSPKKPEKK